MFGGKTPSITEAQIAALLTFVVGQVVAWGFLDMQRARTLVSVGSIIVATAWKLADAYLRAHRAIAHVPTPDPVPPTPPAGG